MSNLQSDTLKYELRGAGAWIVMTRPQEMNPLSPSLIADLDRAFVLAEEDRRVRAIVITGMRDAFCAGADLKFLQSLDGSGEATVQQLLLPLTGLLTRLKSSAKPVIAAVNGHCVAGGLEFVLCCDLILASEEQAVFSDGHARYGLLPAIGGAQGLARALGPFKAKEMLFTSNRYSAREMETAGLVNWVVKDSELHRNAETLVETLAAHSPLVLRRMKQMVNDEWEMSWATAARNELTINEHHLSTDVPIMGLRAFAERRNPKSAK